MSRPRPTEQGQAPLDVVEDAVQLLRTAPPWVHVVHLAGSGACVLGWLWFWSDMTRGVFADRRLAPGAMGMACLYLLMKLAHAVHATELRAILTGTASGAWTIPRLARLLVTQGCLQPIGFLLLPLSLFPLLLVPFPWVLAWLEAVSATGDEASGSPAACARHALRHALAWPGQNHGIIGILLLVATAVLLDVAVAVAAAPYLAHVLLGIETDFNLGPAAYLNTTFLLSIPALAFLVLDPLVKAIYVIRGFHRDARHTGADLLARLRDIRRTAALGLPLVALAAWLVTRPASPTTSGFSYGLLAQPPGAAPASVNPERLAEDLRRVMDQAEYQWRAPRELSPEDPEAPAGEGRIRRWLRGVLKDFGSFTGRNLDALFSAIGRLLQSLLSGFKGPKLPSDGTQLDWTSGLKWVAYVLLLAALGGIAWILARLYQGRPRHPVAVVAIAHSAIPDLASEHVSAEMLPEDGWLALASEKAALGEWRLALRAVYLGSLAHLARRELVRLGSAKSNREYLAELRRRARAFPVVPEAFGHCSRRFERVWYGNHEATPQLLAEAHADLEAMKGNGAS